MDPVAAQRAIATLHSFRFLGLFFILPGVVGAHLPAGFAGFPEPAFLMVQLPAPVEPLQTAVPVTQEPIDQLFPSSHVVPVHEPLLVPVETVTTDPSLHFALLVACACFCASVVSDCMDNRSTAKANIHLAWRMTSSNFITTARRHRVVGE